MGFNTSLGLGGSYSLTNSPTQTVSANNYLDLANTANQGWAQQYLPELYEQEIERYGNRTINGFLAMVGAEMPMQSDQVVWSEQNRLHIAYKNKSGNETAVITTVSSGLCTLGSDYTNSVRVGATVIVTDAATGLKTNVCRVSATSGQTFNVLPYKVATLAADFNDGDAINVFVFGSEFAKGSASMVGELKPQFTKFDNRPIIIKDHFKISGSDTAQIGWVETIDESGQSGFSWYMKSASETRLRFEDYLEMSMIESVKGVPGSSTADTDMGIAGENFGTEGLFQAVETRGNVFEDLASLADFDLVLKNLDKQGAIEENILYVNRDLALTFDDMMAGLNANYGGGASFGVFENSADMALNLGFSGLRRGSYDFYKSDWRYLNDATGRGGFGDISGILIPAGVSSVYDENLGRNIKRPFLHVRYRASQTDDRRMKSWVTGSVGGASYIGDDIMEVHYLSERCLVVQAANNFVLLKES
jgi:hypothetical protein